MVVYKISRPESPEREMILDDLQDFTDFMENAEVYDVFTVSVEEMTEEAYADLEPAEEF